MLTELRRYYAYATNHLWSLQASGGTGHTTWLDTLANWIGPTVVLLAAAIPLAFFLTWMMGLKSIPRGVAPLAMIPFLVIGCVIICPLWMVALHNRPDVIRAVGRTLRGDLTVSGEVAATTCRDYAVGQDVDTMPTTSFTLLGEARQPPYRWAARVTRPGCEAVLMMDSGPVVVAVEQYAALQKAALHPKPPESPPTPVGPSAAEKANLAAELASVPQ